MKFSDTLKELDQISAQLKAQGITVEKLDRAITDLKAHQDNIEKIEENIDAIKQEVIGPIQAELEQNRIAGKFSVFGFWIGTLGLLVSIATIIFQGSPFGSIDNSTSSAAIVEELKSIEQQLLFPNGIKAQVGEVFVSPRSPVKLASDGAKELFLEVGSVADVSEGRGLKSGVKLFRGSSQIGRASLEQGLVRSDGQPGLRQWYDDNEIALAEGDSLTIANVKLEVLRIFSTRPLGRLIGDDKDGMLIKVSGGRAKK